MLRKLMLTTLACLVLLAGCGGPPKLQSFKPNGQDEAVVASQILKIQQGINFRSVDLLMQPYAEDAYIGNFHRYIGVSSPGALQSISKAQLRGAYTELLKGVKDISMEISGFRLTIAGDKASAQGTIEMVYKIEKGRGESKRPDVVVNEVIWRLKRTPEGWKIQEEIFQ